MFSLFATIRVTVPSPTILLAVVRISKKGIAPTISVETSSGTPIALRTITMHAMLTPGTGGAAMESSITVKINVVMTVASI